MTADQKGLNFGWYFLEGTEVYAEGAPPDGLTPPLFAYRHDEIGPAAIGGKVYRGTAIPGLGGCVRVRRHGRHHVRRRCRRPDHEAHARGSGVVTGIATGPDGELYLLTHCKGILKVVPG